MKIFNLVYSGKEGLMVAELQEMIIWHISPRWADYLIWLTNHAKELENEVDRLEKRIEHGA